MRFIERPWIEVTGLTMCNVRAEERCLPGGELTDEMLYHLFASGVFSMVRVNRGFGDPTVNYDHAAQMRFVHERDEREIRRLKFEVSLKKEGEGDSR